MAGLREEGERGAGRVRKVFLRHGARGKTIKPAGWTESRIPARLVVPGGWRESGSGHRAKKAEAEVDPGG